MTDVAWTETTARIAGSTMHLSRGGGGRPVLVLHHDIGTPDRLPFYDALAEQFDVIVPRHPGFGARGAPAMDAPARATSPRSINGCSPISASSAPACVGLGFGGWIAAEMAALAPRDFHRLVLVGAMGVKPPEGDIFDQAIVSYIDYARAGFHDPGRVRDASMARSRPTSSSPGTLCREMCFRIAWKPYMYSQTLPHLLGGVRAPALVVWGDDDKIVPTQRRRTLCEVAARGAVRDRRRLPATCVDMEQPEALARLVTVHSSPPTERPLAAEGGTPMHLMYFTEQPMSAYPAGYRP